MAANRSTYEKYKGASRFRISIIVKFLFNRVEKNQTWI